MPGSDEIWWQDDPQDRAPMTEALDDIAKLCAIIDKLEDENTELMLQKAILQRDLKRCHESKAQIGDKCLRLETERDAARKERNEYFAERNKACERASALGVQVYELKAENERLKKENGDMDSMYQDRLLDFEGRAYKAETELESIRQAQRDAYRH